MSERVEWIRGRLDELEAAAKAARPGPWRLAENEWDGKHIAAADAEAVMGVYGFGVDDPYAAPNSEHIALNDPAAVLARVAADRAILAMHQAVVEDFTHVDETVRDHARREVLEDVIQMMAEGLGWKDCGSE